MAVTTLTSKGQMTLPKDVRDDLKLGPGDKIDIVKRDGVYLLRPRRSALDLIGKYKRPGTQVPTQEDMDKSIGEAVDERYERSLDRD